MRIDPSAGNDLAPPRTMSRMLLSARSRRAWPRILHDRLASAAAAVLILTVLAAIFAPLICPYPPNEPHMASRLVPPGTPGFLLGADGQGRDMLSRLIMGTRTSLALGLVPVTVAAVIGLILGAAAAFLGRAVEVAIMRFLDVFFGLPPALLAILVAACLGPSLLHMLAALTIVAVPPMARVAYRTVIMIKELLFVEAARASGASSYRILFRHILPSALPPIMVFGTSLSGAMIVLGAGLSFVGVGIQPPTADWGRMINDGRSVLPIAPHVATLPGLAIFVVASAFSLLGESFRDVLDPRTKRLEL